MTETTQAQQRFASYKEMALHYKRVYEAEHQRYIALNGMMEEYQNEFNGLLRKRNVDVEKLETLEILSDYAAHKDIQDVVHERKPRTMLRITQEVVILVLGFFFIWQLVVNEGFRAWIAANFLAIILFAGVITFAGVYAYRQLKVKR